eukprot:15035041-Ditylum_brightwellii.AAC.1
MPLNGRHWASLNISDLLFRKLCAIFLRNALALQLLLGFSERSAAVSCEAHYSNFGIQLPSACVA